MTLEEQLESFYVDAGLTERDLREELAPEGDVERWLGQARIRIGPYAQKSVRLGWLASDSSVDLPTDCVDIARIDVTQGTLPPYDKWGLKLAFRMAATADGVATLYYNAYFGPAGDESDPRADLAYLAAVSYALSRFYRKLASSRSDYRRYATITGQAGVEAEDLRVLADDHLSEFASVAEEISLGAPSTFYGE